MNKKEQFRKTLTLMQIWAMFCFLKNMSVRAQSCFTGYFSQNGVWTKCEASWYTCTHVSRIIYPLRGYINPKKLTKFYKKVYPLPLKTTTINNLIRKYSFMRSYLNIITFIFYPFLMLFSQYSRLNL